MRDLKKFENYSSNDMPQTVVDIIVNSPDHTILKTAVLACGLEKTLSESTFTVFAPTNDAFNKLPEGTLDGLLEDTDALTDILLYHVVEGKALSTSLENGDSIKTLEGSDLMARISNAGVYINDAKVIGADLEAQMGVVHVIDSVLMP